MLLSLFAPVRSVAATAPHAVGSKACAALANFRPDIKTRINTSEWVAASAGEPWQSPDGFRHHAIVKVPFCRIAGQIAPTDESSIGFEVWLPARESWNGRFFGTASGGSMGAIQYPALVIPLERGYAAMGHDNGHASANVYEQNWAFDAETGELLQEKLVDFAHRAQHAATVVAKAVAAEFYREDPRRSYYVGCSQGGHHGMMEAQRYPDDYDGIVAGAHGGEWTGMVASEAWAATQVFRNGRAGALSAKMADAVSRRAIEHCDAVDGLDLQCHPYSNFSARAAASWASAMRVGRARTSSSPRSSSASAASLVSTTSSSSKPS